MSVAMPLAPPLRAAPMPQRFTDHNAQAAAPPSTSSAAMPSDPAPPQPAKKRSSGRVKLSDTYPEPPRIIRRDEASFLSRGDFLGEVRSRLLS